jgi:hypothetical protein
LKKLLKISLIPILSLALLVPSEAELPQGESKEKIEVLESWELYHTLESPQTIEEVADMLYDKWHESIKFQTDKPIPWDTDEELIDHPLNLIIYQWTKQFCILNDWPIPECGPIVHQRLYDLIVNRT